MKFFCAILLTTIGLELQAQTRTNLVVGMEAVVHSSVITSYEVEYSMMDAVRELGRQYAGQPAAFDRKYNEIREDNRDRLIENQLILHEFQTAGYMLPETVIDEVVQQKIRRYGDRATLTKSVQAEGLTFDKYRKQIRELYIVEQMRLKNVSGAILISPHKIETYYVNHTNDFKVEEQVKLRMIVLSKTNDDTGQTRQLAEVIASKINGGTAFGEMASIYSQDSKRSQGGDWGWWDPTRLLKELADAISQLKPGERKVVETLQACYVVQVEERKPEHIRPLTEVRNEIEKKLQAEEEQRLQKQWIAQLKKKTFVRYF
jgi:peptidyl-prolyl cis-trans isomerase SurA